MEEGEGGRREGRRGPTEILNIERKAHLSILNTEF